MDSARYQAVRSSCCATDSWAGINAWLYRGRVRVNYELITGRLGCHVE